jgi:anaerobic selenocysteine-containing dehydrogenase
MTNVRTITTMCPMNCHPTFCGMRVTVDGEHVLGIDGDPDNPDSRGFLCVRGRATHEIRDNPGRILRPLRRTGPRGSDRWEPISWDTALAEITGAISATARDRVGMWTGHGVSVTGIARPLIMRFGHLAGLQVWNPAMICWALGGYGLGLTGVLECNTKEDMAANSRTILMWGANLASQPTTAPYLVAARRNGARVVAIDCRRAEAARHADETMLIRPGTDAALALAVAHVIVREGLTDATFLAEHALGFEGFAAHVERYTPEWAAPITGLGAKAIRELAQLYARETPAMIVLGGSSLFKHRNGWEAARAIACLPALTGQLGIPGGGFGPRHRGFTRGASYSLLEAADRRPPGSYIPNHMPSITRALEDGRLDVLLLLGTNMLSSFADAGALERGMARTGLVVAVDIFPSETVRRAADIVLPGTVWLEELGVKDTATHLYLMERALPPAGEARPVIAFLRALAERLNLEDFFPWPDVEGYLDAWLAPQRGDDGAPLTIERFRAAGGRWERAGLSHVAYPDRRFHTPSGKVELWSERAAAVGLPPLPSYTDSAFTAPDDVLAARFPLQLGQGRTINHFHSFYDQGRALPALARLEPEPELWMHPLDATDRGLCVADRAVLFNDGGELLVRLRVTEDVRPGVVWLRDGWFGLNHLTNGSGALDAAQVDLVDPLRIPGGQSAFDARVEVRGACGA